MRGLKIAAVSVMATGALYGCSPKAEAPAQGAPPVTVATPLKLWSEGYVDEAWFAERLEDDPFVPVVMKAPEGRAGVGA